MIDVEEARDRGAVRAVAPADAEDVDLELSEVFRDAIKLVDGARFAEHAAIA